jgi:hypothetical protein
VLSLVFHEANTPTTEAIPVLLPGIPEISSWRPISTSNRDWWVDMDLWSDSQRRSQRTLKHQTRIKKRGANFSSMSSEFVFPTPKKLLGSLANAISA